MGGKAGYGWRPIYYDVQWTTGGHFLSEIFTSYADAHRRMMEVSQRGLNPKIYRWEVQKNEVRK